MHHFESGFVVREPAWHGLATVLDKAPSIDEAIRLAGLDWVVADKPIFYELDDGGKRACESHKALVRESDGSVLGVVGKRYEALQNSVAFNFFEPLVKEGVVTLETAGSLKGGRRVWVLAKFNKEAEVLPGDSVGSYLLISNAHDGTRAVNVIFTRIRTVCWNTLSAAERDADRDYSPVIRVRHSKNVELGLEAIRNIIDIENRTFNASIEQYRAMANAKLPLENIPLFVKEALPDGDASFARWKDGAARKNNAFDSTISLAENGAGAALPGVKGTVWGAYNAFTEYVDHYIGRNEESRLDSQWFGTGKVLKNRALDVAVNYC